MPSGSERITFTPRVHTIPGRPQFACLVTRVAAFSLIGKCGGPGGESAFRLEGRWFSHPHRLSMIRSPYNGTDRKLVLAFDIGTTYSGAAYASLDPREVPEVCSVTK